MKVTALKMTKLSSYIEESTTNWAAVVRTDWSREDCIAGALIGTSSWHATCHGRFTMKCDISTVERDGHLKLCRIALA